MDDPLEFLRLPESPNAEIVEQWDTAVAYVEKGVQDNPCGLLAYAQHAVRRFTPDEQAWLVDHLPGDLIADDPKKFLIFRIVCAFV